MSPPPCMPFWVGDYLRDTQHLTCEQHGAYLLLIVHCWQHGAIPADDVGRAQVTKLITVKRWNAIKAAILPFFEPDGTHRRVTKERARVEHITTVRTVAGSKGGFRSAASRNNKSRAPPQAKLASNSQSNHSPNAQLKSSSAQAYQTKNQNLTSSEYDAARARAEEMPEKQQDNASEQVHAALTKLSNSIAEASTKRPTEMTRDDFEKSFAARRPKSPEPDEI